MATDNNEETIAGAAFGPSPEEDAGSVSEGGESAGWDQIEAASLLQGSGAERYEIGEELGRGSMGTVLEARDVNIRRSVAMKLIGGLGLANPIQAIRFVEEAQITGQLEHSAIVPVYELGLNADREIFYTMKCVRGRTLADVLKKIRERRYSVTRQFPLMRLLRIFVRVCDAVSFAHSKHVVHRDLKPQNIMIEDFGEVFVMDWGLAKVLSPTEETRQRMAREARKRRKDADTALRKRIESVREDLEVGACLTMNDEMMGTPPFMAPEQIRGVPEGAGPLADVYALGAILYAILTLKSPLADEGGLRDVLWKTVRGEVPPASEVASRVTPRKGGGSMRPGDSLSHLPDGRVPDALSAVAAKAMAVEPAARYQSVSELQDDVESYMSGFATSAEQAGFCRQLTLLVRRNRIPVTAAAAAVAIIVGVMAAAYTRTARSERRAVSALAKLRSAAPAYADQARLLISRKEIEEALARADHAAELKPDVAEYHALRGDLLQTLRRFADSANAYERALRLAPGDSRVTAGLRLSRRLLQRQRKQLATPEMLAVELHDELVLQKRAGEAAYLESQTPGLRGDVGWSVDGWELPEGWRLCKRPNRPGLLIRLDCCKEPRAIETIPAPLRSIGAASLSLRGTAIADLSPLAGVPLEELLIDGTPVTDLSPLRGMPLQRLDASRTKISDLSPLEGMPLEELLIDETAVADLSPLRGMPLKRLGVSYTEISDLSPLVGMPLVTLDAVCCARMDDFTPLASLRELEVLWLPAQAAEADLSFLRDATLTPNLQDLRTADNNLIMNGGFDSSRESWGTWGTPVWQVGTAPKAGAGCVKLSGASGSWAFQGRAQNSRLGGSFVVARASGRFRLRGFVKASPNLTGRGARISVCINEEPVGGGTVREAAKILGELVKSTEWTPRTLDFIPSESINPGFQLSSLTVFLSVARNDGAGYACFDAVSLIHMGSPPE